MTDQVKEEEFFHHEPLSLRAISREWVINRALELGRGSTEPDIRGALAEAVELITARTAWNLAEGRDVLVYEPDGEGDPYVVAIPLNSFGRGGGKPRLDPPATQTPKIPDTKRRNIVDDFEDIVFEMDFELTPSDLDRDQNGRYINAHVRALFTGFKMYHDKLTMARSEQFRINYNKTLGRYVLAKVGNNGIAIFTKAPFRHLSKAMAIEEANRLSEQLDEAVGIFRCLDIIKVDKEG